MQTIPKNLEPYDQHGKEDNNRDWRVQRFVKGRQEQIHNWMTLLGIGYAVTEYLISNSHNVVLLARSTGPLEELKERSPERVSICAGDLGDFSFAERSVNIALKEFGRLDGLILNHGVLEPATRIADSDPEAWRKCFDVNFFSLVAFVRLHQIRVCQLLNTGRSKPLCRLFEKPRVE